MNYFNPYFYNTPVSSPSNFFGFLKNARGINFSTILNGTQRTLNIINQAIPVIKQMSPVVKNAKTMFRVMNEFKKVDDKGNVSVQKQKSNSNFENAQTTNLNENAPTFFL